MKQVKTDMDALLEKRFIYFICSRKKVRFSTKVPPLLSKDGNLKLSLILGREEVIKEVEINSPREESGLFPVASIEGSGRFISFTCSTGSIWTFPIHEFLLESGINLGFDTKVEYVGLTETPHKRPLNRIHGGLNDILYRVSIDDNDILIYFNVFKVMAVAENETIGVSFRMANSMIDEVNVETEGNILEKCFIFYFDSSNQFRNKKKEKLELEQNLMALKNENKIRRIAIDYEVDDKSEYYVFSSSRVAPQNRHTFTIEVVDEKLTIKDGALIYDPSIE